MSASSHSFSREEMLPEAAWEDVEKLEVWRRELRARNREGKQILATSVLVAVLWFFAMKALLPGDGLFLAVVMPLLGLLVMWFLVDSRCFKFGETDYQREFKKRVVGVLLAALAPEMRLEPQAGLGRDWFMASRLFASRPDRYGSEDLFSGRVGKTDLKFCEVHAEEKRRQTDSNGRSKTYYVTTFRGILLVADFNKHFRSWVTVMPDVAERYFGFLGQKLQELGGDVQRMESAEFEDLFVARGPDAVESRYLLTLAMQERLVALRRRLGVDFRLSLHDSRLWLAFPQISNWFEGDWRLPADDRAQMREILNQMRWCVQIVEELDLNTRIWTKE